LPLTVGIRIWGFCIVKVFETITEGLGNYGLCDFSTVFLLEPIDAIFMAWVGLAAVVELTKNLSISVGNTYSRHSI